MNKNGKLKICSLLLVTALLFGVCGCKGETGKPLSSRPSPARPSGVTDSSKDESGDSAFSETTVSDNTVTSSDTAAQETVTVMETVEYDAEKNPLKRGVNFSNFEMNYKIGYDDWIFQAKYYDMLREKGFDHIRLPVDFFRYMDLENAPDYPIEQEALRMIDTVINTALNAGLKIVLDFHHFGELQKNFTANKAKYIRVWEQLSVHYQNYPSGLIFELINEPCNPSPVRNAPDPINPTRCMQIQNEAIKIIRKTNPTRLIVHATKWNNSVTVLDDTTLPEDDNIIMSVHVYDPLEFTHQGNDWLGAEYLNKRSYSEAIRVELDGIFAKIADYQNRTGRPVWLGEFGVTDKTDKQDRYQYAALVNELCKKYKIGWCWWEFGSGFGIYNLEKDAWTADGVIDALTK